MSVRVSVTATCIKSDAVIFIFVINLPFQLEHRDAELEKKHSGAAKRITQVQRGVSRQTNRATIKHLVSRNITRIDGGNREVLCDRDRMNHDTMFERKSCGQ